MLVLKRKKSQQITIGRGSDAVTLTITDIAGNRVAIGIDAPQSTPIARTELLGDHQWPLGQPSEEGTDAA